MLCTVLRQHLLLSSILIQVSQSSVILFGEWRRSALSGHTQRWTKTVLIQFPQGINNENENIFNTRFLVLFRNYFTNIGVTSQHAGSELNATVVSRFSVDELILKQLLIMKSQKGELINIWHERDERKIWVPDRNRRTHHLLNTGKGRGGGGHSIHWVTRTHEEQGYSMKREHRVCRAQIKFFWAPKV